MTHKLRGVRVEKYAYYANKRRQNVGLETWIWRQIVTSQRAHTKYKWLPYATEWKPQWKFSAYATECIDAFKMKLKLYFSVIKRNLKEQGECVENIVNFAKYIKNQITTRGLW